MSIASLGSVSFSFFQATFSVPATSSATPTGPAQQPVAHELEHEDRSRFKVNSLVTAMMSAFAALGLGQSAASPAAATPSAAKTDAAASSAPATTAATGAGAASAATGTATTATAGTTSTATTDAAASSDTLEAAVTEFANALFSALQTRGHEGHDHGRHEHEHSDERPQGYHHGYNGFVQRLDRLVQSLGATAPVVTSTASETAANSSAATTPSSATSTSATTTSTTTASTSVPAAQPAAPAPSPRMTRLLSAFTKVMDLLQPQGAAAAATGTSMADKLKQFLSSLSQSLHTQASAATPSGVGSRLDVTV